MGSTTVRPSVRWSVGRSVDPSDRPLHSTCQTYLIHGFISLPVRTASAWKNGCLGRIVRCFDSTHWYARSTEHPTVTSHVSQMKWIRDLLFPNIAHSLLPIHHSNYEGSAIPFQAVVLLSGVKARRYVPPVILKNRLYPLRRIILIVMDKANSSLIS